MGSTFLDLTNKVIRRVNDIELTSLTFGAATGFSAVAKDAVIDSIRRINQHQNTWPFNYTDTTQTLTADQAVYSFPADLKVPDWDSFLIQKSDALSVPAKNLYLIDYDEWIARFRERDKDLETGEGGIPDYVYRTQDNKMGFSTVPDKAYVVEYGYWATPDDLSLHSDTTNIPTAFDHLIVSGALYYVYMFRSNEQAASIENSRFNEGLRAMRTLLINNKEYVYDTRSSSELARSPGKRRAYNGAF